MIIKVGNTGKKGLTLIELVITTSMMSVLVFTVGYTMYIGMKVSNQSYDNTELDIRISQALELMTNSLRLADSIDTLTESSVTFTADLRDQGSEDNRFYLYNASDAEPNPPYTQDTYQLRWAQGTVTYGLGAVIASDIAQPTSAAFSQSGNLIIMNFTVSNESDSVDMRSNVRVRNL